MIFVELAKDSQKHKFSLESCNQIQDRDSVPSRRLEKKIWLWDALSQCTSMTRGIASWWAHGYAAKIFTATSGQNMHQCISWHYIYIYMVCDKICDHEGVVNRRSKDMCIHETGMYLEYKHHSRFTNEHNWEGPHDHFKGTRTLTFISSDFYFSTPILKLEMRICVIRNC